MKIRRTTNTFSESFTATLKTMTTNKETLQQFRDEYLRYQKLPLNETQTAYLHGLETAIGLLTKQEET
jgi:hypothetical protein